MKTNIINIGNSQGIILPSALLRQLNLTLKSIVEVVIENGNIIIKPNLRQGWAEVAKQIHIEKDDKLLSEDFPNKFDQEEWTW